MRFHGRNISLLLLLIGTQGCNHGFYGTHCNKTCSTTCKTNICSPNGICQDCKNGFYGIRCNHNCPVTCMDGECYRYNVACVQGCKRGWYGKKCQHQCNNCTGACVKGRCLLETSGTTHSKFVPIPIKCEQNSMLEGGCMDGCRGESCETPCHKTCLQCDRHRGNCSSCVAGRYGERCDQQCPVSCPRTCDRYGDCVTGRVEKYFSPVGNNQINIHKDCKQTFIMTAVGVFGLLVTSVI